MGPIKPLICLNHLGWSSTQIPNNELQQAPHTTQDSEA